MAQCAPCAPAAGGFGVGMCAPGALRAEFLVDRRADIAHRRTRVEHLPRSVRDVDADRAFDAVLVPRQDVAVFSALLDEAVVVGAVARALAAAETRNVAEDLGMVRREPVGRGNHLV